MANEYMALEELKHARELTGKTFADHDMERALSSASRAIEGMTGRRFWVDTVDVTRYYTARSATLTLIDDLSTPTTVTVDGSLWVENTDYVFEPLNAAADGRPYTMISAVEGASFPMGRRKVEVIGKWGWASVPPGVVEATGLLASRLLLRQREAPFGVIFGGVDQAATRIARNDPDVMLLLEQFMEGIYVA